MQASKLKSRNGKSQALTQEPQKRNVYGLKLLNQLQSKQQMTIVPYDRLEGFGIFIDITESPPNENLTVGQSATAQKLGACIYLKDSYNGQHIIAPSDLERLRLKLQ